MSEFYAVCTKCGHCESGNEPLSEDCPKCPYSRIVRKVEPLSCRRIHVRIGSGFLPMMFGQGRRIQYEVAKYGLPDKATIVDCFIGSGGTEIVLVLESDEFAEIPLEGPYPEYTPILSRIDPVELATTEPGIN